MVDRLADFLNRQEEHGTHLYFGEMYNPMLKREKIGMVWLQHPDGSVERNLYQLQLYTHKLNIGSPMTHTSKIERKLLFQCYYAGHYAWFDLPTHTIQHIAEVLQEKYPHLI